MIKTVLKNNKLLMKKKLNKSLMMYPNKKSKIQNNIKNIKMN